MKSAMFSLKTELQTLLYHMEFFEAFVSLKISNLQQKSLKIAEINNTCDIFDLFRSILSHFATEVCKYVQKSALRSVFVEFF